jgi:hypothetical protein
LSTVLAGVGPISAGKPAPGPSGSGAVDTGFWLLFDCLQCPALFHFAPQIGVSRAIFVADAGLLSMSAPRPAGRSPPFSS